MEKFNYAKLRGFIAEHFVTHSNFAKFLGIGTTALSERMQNKVPFTQREIAKVAREENKNGYMDGKQARTNGHRP